MPFWDLSRRKWQTIVAPQVLPFFYAKRNVFSCGAIKSSDLKVADYIINAKVMSKNARLINLFDLRAFFCRSKMLLSISQLVPSHCIKIFLKAALS